ncbi:MAG TPA: prolipoprotein diacylglyceryl transferase family protein [Chitinophagales bacterium]|nr:prolipoprotein diacylglyceryl transferase family protein [Chitinophagales bacterium]
MFSRCYPTLSDMISDLTGLNIPLPIFSYGFFLALGFLAAAYTLALEMKRKEQLGLLKPFKHRIEKGKPATPAEMLIHSIIGFVIGYKLLWVIFNYREFAANPQETLLSSTGSWIGGIAGAALLGYFKYWEKNKQRLDKPVTELEEVHPHQTVGDLTIVAAVSGIIGAKLFYFFESPGNFTEFLNDPFGSFFGGLTAYGGLIVGAICVMWYAWKKGMNPIHVADATSPGLFLAYAFGRQGCQVAGDGDWGIVNLHAKPSWLAWLPDRLWAFSYPHNIIDEGIKIQGCTEAHCYILPQAVFPTPMYETFATLLLFAVLWSVRKKITIPGMMFSFYFILNGIERYFIEKIRVNTRFDFLGLHLTQAEIIAAICVLLGAAGLVYFIRKHKG